MILPLPYARQGTESSNCGPCSIKMVADYYRVRNRNRKSYSISSLNRLLNVRYDQGCEKSDIVRVLKRLGLKRHKIGLHQLRPTLKKKIPVISLFTDETGEGHYAVITGYTKKHLIFNDSYHGKSIKRATCSFKKRLKPFGSWLCAVYPSHNPVK